MKASKQKKNTYFFLKKLLNSKFKKYIYGLKTSKQKASKQKKILSKTATKLFEFQENFMIKTCLMKIT